MPRHLRFKPSLREQMRRSARSSLFQANPQRRQELLADPNVHESVKEGIRRQIAFEQEMSQPAKKRQSRADSPHKGPLEREIQAAIIEALQLHPRVAKVVRFNQGAAYYENAQGRKQLVFFSSELVVDLYVMMFEGRYAWLEVKREGWKPHVGPFNWANRTLQREADQAKFLREVRAAGGIGAFVTSVDEALEAIK